MGREALQALVERRLDVIAAELHLLLAVLAEALGELLRRPAEEARLVLLRVEVARPELEPLPHRLPQLRLGDVAVLAHRVQHLVPPDARARADCVSGSNRVGACGSPASSAACTSVSFEAGLEKYVLEAAWAP